MDTVFPTEAIEEMKEQGVNKHLIDLVSMDFNAFRVLVGRNIENGAIYKQFLNTRYFSNTTPFHYAFAAGLISRADADFLTDFANAHITPNPGPI